MNEDTFILGRDHNLKNEVFKDFESDIKVGIWLLRDPTQKAAKS